MKLILTISLLVAVISSYAQRHDNQGRTSQGRASQVQTKQVQTKQEPPDQDYLMVKDVQQVISENGQLSYLVVIPQTNLKDVQKDWKKYVSTKKRSKSKFENGINIQYGVTNKNITSGPFDVHSEMQETYQGVQLRVWLMQNNSALLSDNQYGNQESAVTQYVRDFAIQEYRYSVERELKFEQEKLKGMESELEKLISNYEKSGKKITENDQYEIDATDAIETNTRDIESTSDKIENQKDMVELTASDPNAEKGALKTLGNLENEKKSLQKENARKNKGINDANKDSRNQERNMAFTEQYISEQMSVILKQKKIVQDVQTKLESIR